MTREREEEEKRAEDEINRRKVNLCERGCASVCVWERERVCVYHVLKAKSIGARSTACLRASKHEYVHTRTRALTHSRVDCRAFGHHNQGPHHV